MNFPLQSLSELGMIQTGSTPLTSEPSYWGGDVPFVTPGELEQNRAVVSAPRTLSCLGVEQSRLLQKDAVMVCCIGSLGKIGIAGRPVVTNQQINSIEFDRKKIWPKYGYYACKRLKSTLISMAPATTIAIISKSKFGRLQIPVPSLAEQRRIAAILDQADSLRVMRQKALTQLDSLTQSIFDEMFGNPATNPKAWPRLTLEELMDEKGPQNGLYKPSTDYGNGTPILRIDAFYDGAVTKLNSLKRVRLSAAELKLYGLNADDIVINRVNSIEYLGKSALIPRLSEPTVFESNMMRFSVKRDLAEPAYIVQFLQTKFLKSQILTCSKNAVNQSSINQQDVKTFQINVPPVTLQETFAAHCTAVESVKATHRAAMAHLDALFASLQHRAFRGEL